MFDMVRDMWSGGWLGRFILLLFIAVAALLLWIVVTFLFWAIDSWFCPLRDGRATVIEKCYSEAYTTTTMVMVGKIFVPQTNHHPESWSLDLQLEDGRCGSFECDQDTWDRIERGTSVTVAYKEGRISNDIYVERMSW
jgi:hypothetical protein